MKAAETPDMILVTAAEGDPLVGNGEGKGQSTGQRTQVAVGVEDVGHWKQSASKKCLLLVRPQVAGQSVIHQPYASRERQDKAPGHQDETHIR